MSRRAPSLVLSLVLLALLPAVARAGWFVGEPIDGPAAISEVGGIDLARDGTGALVYTRLEGGVPHVYLSRLNLGVWRAPERLDTGLETPSSQPVVAVADDHRIMVAWVSGGRLYGSSVAGGSPGPLPAPTLLFDGLTIDPVRDPAAAMSINGTGYVTFTAPGGGGTDVRAVRLQESTWALVPATLDIVADQAAGDGPGRSRVAVSAEGNAVVTWGEVPPGQPRRVYARRVTGLNVSVAPQEVSLPSFDGRAAAGAADLPDIAIEDDGSYAWVVFRQAFDGGTRALTRRLVGSLFEAPVAVDGLGFPSEGVDAPDIAMDGRGVGAAVVGRTSSRSVGAAFLLNDAFGSGLNLSDTGSVTAPSPQVAVGENRDVLVAWRRDPGAGPTGVRGRYRPRGKGFEAEAELADPTLGPVVEDSVRIASDRYGDTGVAFLQGDLTTRRLVVAVFDRRPSGVAGRNTTRWQPRSSPRLAWSGGVDVWGALTYEVRLDGETIATLTGMTDHVPAEPVEDGSHRWQVIGKDRRGQTFASKPRLLRIDTTEPVADLRISGIRRKQRLLSFRTAADDAGGSGVAAVTVDFGDGSAPTSARLSSHRYRRAGFYTVRVRTRDRAGNTGESTERIRIRN